MLQLTGLYSLVGKMISVCLIHGGVAPRFSRIEYVSGKPTGPASLADIGDQHVHEINHCKDDILVTNTLKVYIATLTDLPYFN